MTASRQLTGAALAALGAALLLAAPAPTQEAAPAADVDLGYGAEQFELCVQCHGSAGEGKPEIQAPAIAGLPAWYVYEQVWKFRNGQRGLHPADVAGLRMHPMARALKTDDDDRQLRAVSAYVESMPAVRPEPTLEGGDPQRGQALYAPCLACHGPDANGNEALKSPPLWRANDWYLLSSLQRYKSGVRAANPANTNAQVMKGMAETLADEQAMKDVVAYIMTLGPR